MVPWYDQLLPPFSSRDSLTLQPLTSALHVARWPWPPPNNPKGPYKKIFCGEKLEKLVAVKVALSSNKVL
jgi:hypothetical protein